MMRSDWRGSSSAPAAVPDTGLPTAPLDTLDEAQLHAEAKRLTKLLQALKGRGVTGSTPPRGRLNQRLWQCESILKTIEAE